jgi:FKBP-type peptidyl-prolyl cis-trans isomerase
MSKRAFALALIATVSAWGCNQTSTTSDSSSSSTITSTTTGAAPSGSADAGAGGNMHKLPSGLQYEDVVVGSGKMAEPGMNVSIQYTGYLTDGTEFDSSRKSGAPLRFQVGGGQMIQGFDEGVKGMRIGGKRKLTIPYQLAYGEAGRPPLIPPKSTLVFDIELVDVQ